jgi:phosphoribosylformimino-5-aminoimidazole carboxamide ribotide isomerase
LATFDLLPAIDLLGGRVVRLRQGDFGQETAYDHDAVAVAERFVSRGARWLHVVDLDGARDGRPANRKAIRAITKAVGDRASVEVAGGLRSLSDVDQVLGYGAARAVVGTSALAQPSFARALVDRYGPDRVAGSLDVRGGFAVGQGWVPDAPETPIRDALFKLTDAGVRWIEVTSIDRDGTLGGPDLELLSLVAVDPRRRVIASGGIASASDLVAVREIGCAGAIVGRAFYDGTLSIEAALASLSEPS